jgi:hypothetical protein
MWLTGLCGAAFAAQPVEFPHNTHMKLGLACIDCHTGADVRSEAGIPSVTKCMLCHAKLAREKPEVKKVIEYANKKQEIPWQRVYSFSENAHVRFPHAAHYQANIACARCHGDLTKETVATRAVDFTMGTCVTCHRERNASQDCAACHY